jgi:hypothetical protein
MAGVSSSTEAAFVLAFPPGPVMVKVQTVTVVEPVNRGQGLVPPPPLPCPLPPLLQFVPGVHVEGALVTVTVAVPAVASCAAFTVAWICVELMLVTARLTCDVVFQFTWEPPEGSVVRRKLVPVMVIGVSALPGAAVLGLTLVTVGTGLGGGLTKNATGLESPLFPAPEKGLWVCTKCWPGFVKSAAGMTADI